MYHDKPVWSYDMKDKTAYVYYDWENANSDRQLTIGMFDKKDQTQLISFLDTLQKKPHDEKSFRFTNRRWEVGEFHTHKHGAGYRWTTTNENIEITPVVMRL